MTKIDIVDRIALVFDLSRDRAREIVNGVLEEIVSGVEEDGRVECRGLGVFAIVTYPARKARNPQTQAIVKVPARRALRFRQSRTIAARLNGAKVETNGRKTRR